MIRLAAFLFAFLPALALAQTPPLLPENATVLHLSDRAERAVRRDRLHATLRVEETDADAPKLQAEINRRMTAAVERAKSVAGVSVETGDYWVNRDAPMNGGLWRGMARSRCCRRMPLPC